MKFIGDKKYIYWGITASFVVMAGILFYYVIFNWSIVSSSVKAFFKIIMPIVDGGVLAFLLAPAVNYFEDIIYNKMFKKVTFKDSSKKSIRVFSIFITFLLFFGVLYQFFKLVIPEVYTSIVNITTQFPTYVNNLENFVNRTLQKNPELEQEVTNLLNNYSEPINRWLNNSVMPQVTNLLSMVTNGLFVAVKTILNFIVGLIISVYLLYNKELFKGQAKKMVYALMQKDTANAFIHNMRFTNKTFSGFVVGKIIDSIIMGLLCLLITSIIGTPYGTLISVIVGFTNIIPFFGPFIGAIPSAFLILMVDPRECLYFIIMILILQQFDGNILGPKILGVSTGISGFWVIFSITLFGGFFGVLGWLVGVPLFAVIYAGIRAYIRTKLQEKNLAWETEKYTTVDYIDENNDFIVIPREEISGVKSRKNFKKNNTNNENKNEKNSNENNDSNT